MKLTPTAAIHTKTNLDRKTEIRSDKDQIDSLWNEADTLIIPMSNGNPLVNQNFIPQFISPVSQPMCKERDRVFIGSAKGKNYFAVDFTHPNTKYNFTLPKPNLFESPEEDQQLFPGASFENLRVILPKLSDQYVIEILTTSRSIMWWHLTNQFCPNCGSITVIKNAGWTRNCSHCNFQQFPRNDPVVIMLITYSNCVLLGRTQNWPTGLYSLLAGFMEPGESVECSVRRETMEEVNIKLKSVQYVASQGWPFPHNLILGCQAQAIHNEIRINSDEIEDAFWITREELSSVMLDKNSKITLPKKGTISDFLIQNWVNGSLLA